MTSQTDTDQDKEDRPISAQELEVLAEEIPGAKGDSPFSLPPKAWWAILKRIYVMIGFHNLSLLAAGVAFFSFLAFVPLIASIVLLYGLIGDPQIVASRGAVDKVSFDRIEDVAGSAPQTKPAAPTALPAPAVEQPRIRTANYVQAKASPLAEQAPSPVRDVALRKIAKHETLGDDFLDGLVDDRSARSRKGKQ